MAPVTEVVLITLIPNADQAVLTESAKTVARQPGCRTVRTSRLHAEPDGEERVHLFIDWDAVDYHRAFARNKEIYLPFRAHIGSIMAAHVPPYHVAFDPYPPSLLEGVAVVGKAWFPGHVDPGAKGGEVEGALEGFVGAVRGDRGLGFDGRVVKGWALEDEILYKGEKSRVFFFALGWESVEAGKGFRESGEFGSAVAGFEGVDGLRGLDISVVSSLGVTS
ncbi:hypothetical protein F4859DRAFT_505386 [Xylaria cf. heliscus]|nr:hypothetical protein F4859DRAFT_505386 [Xylaria cf. heliscus]